MYPIVIFLSYSYRILFHHYVRALTCNHAFSLQSTASTQLYPLQHVFDGAYIEVVDSFCYLGFALHCAEPCASTVAAPRKATAKHVDVFNIIIAHNA